MSNNTPVDNHVYDGDIGDTDASGPNKDIPPGNSDERSIDNAIYGDELMQFQTVLLLIFMTLQHHLIAGWRESKEKMILLWEILKYIIIVLYIIINIS